MTTDELKKMVKTYWQSKSRKEYKDMVARGEWDKFATNMAKDMMDEHDLILKQMNEKAAEKGEKPNAQFDQTSWEFVLNDFLPQPTLD